MFDGERFLKPKVPHGQVAPLRELVVGLPESEVHLLMRGDHAVGRQRDAERLRVGGRHGDHLATRDQAAIDVLVRAVVVPLVPGDRTAERRRDIVGLGVGLARGRRQEERLRRHRVALETEARRSVHVVGARRRDRVVDHPRRLAELRRETVGDDLHFPDEDLGHRQHAKPGAILLRVGVAINLIVRVHLRCRSR